MGQLAAVIDGISDPLYAERLVKIYDASIGLHVRHIIDHYDMFFLGLSTRRVNYDERPRETQVETNRALALQRIHKIIGQMKTMQRQDDELTVIMDLQSDETVNTQQKSSVARELTFLHSHATHHYATIAFMLRALDMPVAFPEFGLAPATIKNQERLKCAP